MNCSYELEILFQSVANSVFQFIFGGIENSSCVRFVLSPMYLVMFGLGASAEVVADASSAAGLVMELKWITPPPELRLTARDGTPPLRHQAETRVAQNVRHYIALYAAEPYVVK